MAAETGVKVVTDLYTHSLGPDAPTYLDMMRWNVTRSSRRCDEQDTLELKM